MKPLIFLSLILATIQVNPTSSSTECTNVSFVNDLENISCPNMKPFTLLDPETSLKKSDCLAACCASGLSDWTGICDTYLFNTTDSSCLLGSVAGYDIADCVNVTAPPGTIVGGGMDRISPLVPKHQFYIRSPPRTEPTHSIDLQSSGERASLVVTRRAATALTVFRSTRLASLRLASLRFALLGLDSLDWKLSIDGQPNMRDILVPHGGYNSDMQRPPLINACQDPRIGDVYDNATYSLDLTNQDFTPLFGDHDDVILLNFGAVNHGSEIYIDGKLFGVHYGPLVPFSVDVTAAFTEAKHSPKLLTIVAHYMTKINWVPTGFVYDEAWNAPTELTDSSYSSQFGHGIVRFINLSKYQTASGAGERASERAEVKGLQPPKPKQKTTTTT